MIVRVERFLEAYEMISDGDTVLIGLSGGADSVLLTEFLKELSEKKGFFLQAVHVNHNLRGEEADRDAAFAERYCKARGIPFFLYSCQVEETARKNRVSTEEAGRIERRRIYERCMREYGADKLALAHHRNDVAETMLHHLSRGTSLTGLASLRPVRGNVIRPLLCLERQEIEEELKRRRIPWCEDATNASDHYTRNMIRHHVIPYLEEHVNRRTVVHMAQASLDLLEAEEYFCDKADKMIRKYGREQENGILLSEEISCEEELLQRYAVRECLQRICGQRKDLGREHLQEILQLLNRQVGKSVSLPGGMEAVRRYEGILLRKRNVRKKEAEIPEEVRIEGEGEYFFGKLRIRVSFLENSGKKLTEKKEGHNSRVFERISEKKYTKCFSYDKIKVGLVLRTRRSGDYLTVRSDGARKKLKDFMIDAKIPQEERDSILLAADGSDIVWVAGFRIGEAYRVREDTGRIIQLEVSGGYTDE